MPIELIRDGDEPVALRISGHDFACEEETCETTVPKKCLAGIRLSEIPDEITIKPVESIKGNSIEINHDIELTAFREGEASAIVEEMYRRKFWDGDVGLSPYMTALREAIDGDDVTSETDFQDDDDYIFLHYEVTIKEDFEMQDATAFVDGVIERVHERTDQLVLRHQDGLTRLFDRGSFEADLSYSLGRNQPVALVMVDIDHFKKVNDTFGHRVGDEVLRTVAQVILDHCDGKHRVGYRYGGEELALMVTGNDAARALKFAEMIRGAVECLRFKTNDLVVSVSVGVAEAGEDRDNDSLVKKADGGLYRAKREGRNRVVDATCGIPGDTA
jgi:diguanylate cyclase (GGDEF)-like protein